MDHDAWKLCFLPCFTLVAIICVLVKCYHSWGKGVLLGGLDRGNVPFPSILNTFHLYSSCCPIFWKWLLHVSQKGPYLHPPMRRRGLNAQVDAAGKRKNGK
jgi:hypothetical protein